MDGEGRKARKAVDHSVGPVLADPKKARHAYRSCVRRQGALVTCRKFEMDLLFSTALS